MGAKVLQHLDQNSYQRIQPFLRESLEKLVGKDAYKVESALSEAVINGLEYGVKVRVKINKIGNQLVLRVKDNGVGFAGNTTVAALLAKGIDQVFLECLLAENGRGLPIMLAWMDRVIYNQVGNEVMLIKKLV